jgi:cell division protein FtsB
MPATEQETTMTDTKAITDALDVLTACTGNGGIPTDEQIDRINAAARTALAALLAEREEKRAEIDKLRAVILAADKLDKAEEQARLSRLSSTTSENEQLRDATEVDFCRAAFRTARDRAGE